jgi:hypothetical protein
MSFNQGKLDGFPVELYDGRFSGVFELEDEEGEAIGYDDTVTFLVVASADKAAFSTLKNGELKRTNTFKILSSRIVPVDTAVTFVETLNEGFNPEPDLWGDGEPMYEDKDFFGDDEEDVVVLAEEEDGWVDSAVAEASDEDVIIVSNTEIKAADPVLAGFLNER